MNDIIKIYTDISANFPEWLQVITGAFITFYTTNPRFRNYVNKAVSKFFKVATGKGILTHELFYREKLFLSYLHRIHFHNFIKTKAFKILLREKIKASIGVPKKIFKEKIKFLKTAHPAEIIALLFEIIALIITTYEDAIIEAYNREFGIYGKEVYRIVYLSEKGFKKHHGEKIKDLYDDVDALSLISTKHTEIIRIFLYQIFFAVQKSLFDCIVVFKKLNGDLDEVALKIKNQGKIS